MFKLKIMGNNNLTSELIKLAESINKLAASLTSQDHVQARQDYIQARRILTLEEFNKEILNFYKTQRSASSYRVLETSLNHLLNYAGNVMLNALNPKTLDSFFIWLMKKAPKGAYNYYRTLKAAFNKAKNWNYINENPFAKITLPAKQKSELITISRPELNLILTATNNKLYKNLFLFAYLTGLRVGEIVSLCWECVNLEKLIIQIGSDSFQTKSRKIRYIPLCTEAAELLQSIKPKVFKITEKEHFVFCKGNGYPFTAPYISKQFKKSVIASGVNPKIHFHTLRHGFATALAKQGVSLYKIQNILGHSSISTVQIYANLDVEDLRDAVKVFDNYKLNNF